LKPHKDVRGRFPILTKHGGGRVTRITLGHHPFDVAGWEGALYPFSFESSDHHSIAREIHTAPPARQTFQAGQAPHTGFSVCTFRSQIEGWHPKDIPAPYAHYNADSDEVMFF
jgi:homogentisate 1,2-dioxygenase